MPRGKWLLVLYAVYYTIVPSSLLMMQREFYERIFNDGKQSKRFLIKACLLSFFFCMR